MAHPSTTSTFAGAANRGLQLGQNSGNIISHFYAAMEPTEPLPLPSSSIPFRRDADFVEHGSILEQLDEQSAAPGSWVALVGLGGVGKSQLAIEQGYRTRVRSPETWVFWVHAGSAARFEQSYRDIADQVKIRGRQDPKADVVKLVRDWLRDPSHGPWLLILDNLDNLDDTQGWSEPQAPHAKEIERGNQTGRHEGHPQLLASYLPYNEHGRVLLTTRSRGVALTLVEEKNIIVVEPMTHSNAITLCEKKLGSVGGGEDKGQLVKALEYMPLAIVQAAAYIVQRAPRCSVRQYLEDFRRSDRKKMSFLDYESGRLQRDQEAQNSIIIIWQISFNHIRQTRASAAELLSLMCFFDRQRIPDTLVRKRILKGMDCKGQDKIDKQTDQAEKEEDNSEISEYSEDNAFEDDILLLKNYFFLSIETNQTFAMHALVQIAMRRWLAING